MQVLGRRKVLCLRPCKRCQQLAFENTPGDAQARGLPEVFTLLSNGSCISPSAPRQSHLFVTARTSPSHSYHSLTVLFPLKAQWRASRLSWRCLLF